MKFKRWSWEFMCPLFNLLWFGRDRASCLIILPQADQSREARGEKSSWFFPGEFLKPGVGARNEDGSKHKHGLEWEQTESIWVLCGPWVFPVPCCRHTPSWVHMLTGQLVPGWLQVIHLYGGGIRTLWAFAAGHRLAKDDSQPIWLPGFLWALVGAQPHPLTDSLSVPLSQAAAGLSTVTDSGPQSLKYQWWGSFHKMFADPAATKPHKRTSNVLSSLFWSQK